MITEEQYIKYGITKEGDVLSSLITHYMTTEFSSGIDISIVNTMYPESFILCFSKFGRIDALRANSCIQKGITDYIQNYAMVELQSVGVSTPNPLNPPMPTLIIDDAYGLKHNGRVVVNDTPPFNVIFSSFSIGRMFNIDVDGGVSDADIMRSVKTFFNDIVTWLNFGISSKTSNITNSIYVESYGLAGETYMNGNGTINFLATDEQKQGIMDSMVANFKTLNSDNVLEISKNSKHIDNYFELVWGIMSTGIVSYLNMNTVSTIDNGISIYAPPPILPHIYSGVSINSETPYTVIFGYEYISVVFIEVITIFDQSISISIPIKIDTPLFKFDFYDINGVLKRIAVPMWLKKLGGSIKTIVDNITKVISEMVDDVLSFITDLLLRIGYVADAIMEHINACVLVITDFITILLEKIAEVLTIAINKLKSIFDTVIVRNLRKIQWELFNTAYANAVALLNSVKSAIEAFVQQITIFNDISKLYNETVAKLQPVSKKINEVNEIVRDYSCLALPLPQIPQLPPIPEPIEPSEEIPTIDEKPDGADSIGKFPHESVEYNSDGTINFENENTVIQEGMNAPIDGLSVPVIPIVDISLDNIIDPIIEEQKKKIDKYTVIGQDDLPPQYKPVKTLKASQTIRDFIKKHEGFKQAYTDKNGVAMVRGYNNDVDKYETIGWGLLIWDYNKTKGKNEARVWNKNVGSTEFITVKEAVKRFEAMIKYCEDTIHSPKRGVRVKMTQNQFDSFVSIIYNAGNIDGDFRNAINRGEYGVCSDRMLGFATTSSTNPSGSKIPILSGRRKKESQMFKKDWGFGDD